MGTLRIIGLMLAFATAAVLLQGCYEEQYVVMEEEPIPMTQYDVVCMVRDGVPNSEIIREIQETGTVFRLSESDVDILRRQGVPEQVISFMLSTPEAPPVVVRRTVVVERPVVVARPYVGFYDPWWTWDYVYAPGYYYYPSHVGFHFGYTHFGGRRHYYHPGPRVRFRR